MNKVEQLQAEIVNNGGWILSDGTLNLQHLLPKAYDLLEGMEAEQAKELHFDILTCFDIAEDNCIESHGLFMSQYHGEAKLHETAYESASYIWNVDVYNYFGSLSPEGFYFGANEGDGACIGWFKLEDEEDEEETDED